MTKRQEFRVLQTYSDFEMREYQPCVIAEVKVSATYSTASSSAFSSLFKYISKGNTASEKIAMTAPVIAAQRANKTEDPARQHVFPTIKRHFAVCARTAERY